jgi:hypothetical protein
VLVVISSNLYLFITMQSLCYCSMNILYVCVICRSNSFMNISYRFISSAGSGKRNSVLYGAVYNVSSE